MKRIDGAAEGWPLPQIAYRRAGGSDDRRDEIMEQMAGIREWGGQFIVPIPEARIVP